jgi:transposase-like protein
LREAEVLSAQGAIAGICRVWGVTKRTLFRWRKEYGGLKIDQAKRLKNPEQENARLRRALSDAIIDNQILREVSKGNFEARPAVGKQWPMFLVTYGIPNGGSAGRSICPARRCVMPRSRALTRRRHLCSGRSGGAIKSLWLPAHSCLTDGTRLVAEPIAGRTYLEARAIAAGISQPGLGLGLRHGMYP